MFIYCSLYLYFFYTIFSHRINEVIYIKYTELHIPKLLKFLARGWSKSNIYLQYLFHTTGTVEAFQMNKPKTKCPINVPLLHKNYVKWHLTTRAGKWEQNSSLFSPSQTAGWRDLLNSCVRYYFNLIPEWPPPLTSPYSSMWIQTTGVFWWTASSELLRLSCETNQPWKRESSMKREPFALPQLMNIPPRIDVLTWVKMSLAIAAEAR